MLNLKESNSQELVTNITGLAGTVRTSSQDLVGALDKLFAQNPNDGDLAYFHGKAKEYAKKLDYFLEEMEGYVQKLG